MLSHLELEVAFKTRPLAMQPAGLSQLSALLDGGRLRSLSIAAGRNPAAKHRAPTATRSGGTAIIAVHGVLTQRPSLLELFGLGTSCATISGQLRDALADPSVNRIALDFDSEGGEIAGIQELATEIRDALGVKPIIAIADSVCASAAYWVASACSQVFVTPGGQIGGVGVVTQHFDQSKALEAAGIAITLVAAGRFKTEGNSFEPLSREGRAHMQSTVDAIGRTFERDIAVGRRVSPATVRRDFGQGRMLRAQDAARVGMADQIATLDDVVSGRAKTQPLQATHAKMPTRLAAAMRDLDLLT